MTIRISRRAGAGLGAIMAMLAATPALADSTIDLGKATLTWGGFLAMESVYRSRSETADIGSPASAACPSPTIRPAHISELRFTARQSRLSLLAQGDVDSDTHLASYYEMDFLGARPDAPIPTKATPTTCASAISMRRSTGTRWAWNCWPARTGRWLTLNSQGITPAQRSDARPPSTRSMSWASTGRASRRSASSRTGTTSSGWRSRWKIPRPPSPANAAAATGVTVTTTHAGGSQFDKRQQLLAQPCSRRHRQGGLGAGARRRPAAAIEAFGIYRSFYDRVNVAGRQRAGPAGRQLATPTCRRRRRGRQHHLERPFPRLLDLQATAMTGSGIGRYGSGQLPDVTLQSRRLAGADPGNHLPGGRHLACHADARHLCLCRPGSAEAQILQCHRHDDHLGLGNPGLQPGGLPGRRRRLLAQPGRREPGHGRLLVARLSGQVRQLPLRRAVFLHPPDGVRAAPAASSRPPTTAWSSPASAIIRSIGIISLTMQWPPRFPRRPFCFRAPGDGQPAAAIPPKALPNPGTLRRLTVPPWAWQMDLTMASPSPAPMLAAVRRDPVEAVEHLVVMVGIDADAAYPPPMMKPSSPCGADLHRHPPALRAYI